MYTFVGKQKIDNTIARKEDNTVDESAAVDLAGNRDQVWECRNIEAPVSIKVLYKIVLVET